MNYRTNPDPGINTPRPVDLTRLDIERISRVMAYQGVPQQPTNLNPTCNTPRPVDSTRLIERYPVLAHYPNISTAMITQQMLQEWQRVSEEYRQLGQRRDALRLHLLGMFNTNARIEPGMLTLGVEEKASRRFTVEFLKRELGSQLFGQLDARVNSTISHYLKVSTVS